MAVQNQNKNRIQNLLDVISHLFYTSNPKMECLTVFILFMLYFCEWLHQKLIYYLKLSEIEFQEKVKIQWILREFDGDVLKTSQRPPRLSKVYICLSFQDLLHYGKKTNIYTWKWHEFQVMYSIYYIVFSGDQVTNVVLFQVHRLWNMIRRYFLTFYLMSFILCQLPLIIHFEFLFIYERWNKIVFHFTFLLDINKRFALIKMFQWNASNFIIFYI